MKHNALPFHKRAMPAAEAAMAAHAQGKFWEMHNHIFENMRSLGDADLEKYAAAVGLDMTKYKAAMAKHTYKKQIDADMALAQKVQSRGTPSFYVNGRNIRGAQPFENFDFLVEEELKKAKAMVAKGIAPKDVYANVIKNGKVFTPLDAKANPMTAEGRPFKGAKDGDIVLYEYSDFQ